VKQISDQLAAEKTLEQLEASINGTHLNTNMDVGALRKSGICIPC
jgi:hypothetical protein